MPEPADHRAVSALFRLFGGHRRNARKFVGELSEKRGMHRGEYRFLAVAMPLSLWGFTADLLGESWMALLWALPITFCLLNVLPFLMNARTPERQWLGFLGGFTLWSAWIFWNREACPVRWLAGFWLAFAVLNAAVWFLLVLRKTMEWPGRAGIWWRIFLLIFVHLVAIGVGFAFGKYWGWLAAFSIGGIYCLAVLRPGCQWLGRVVTTTDREEIWITIDDGPDPVDTPRLLELLDVYEEKAIFFMIGEKVRQHPELAREVIRRGHEIGNHTMTHPQAWFWSALPGRTRREIEACQKVIQETTGQTPRWFRAPVGHRNFFTHPVTRELGLEVLAWNRRGFDAVETNVEKVLANILPDLQNGDIVLLHESTPIAVEVLEKVLSEIQRQRK